jgi:hypothetical protein
LAAGADPNGYQVRHKFARGVVSGIRPAQLDGPLEMLGILLDAGLRCDKSSWYPPELLMEAIDNHDLKALQAILRHHTYFDPARDQVYTATLIGRASDRRRWDMVEAIVESGPSLHEPNENGLTIGDFAAAAAIRCHNPDGFERLVVRGYLQPIAARTSKVIGSYPGGRTHGRVLQQAILEQDVRQLVRLLELPDVAARLKTDEPWEEQLLRTAAVMKNEAIFHRVLDSLGHPQKSLQKLLKGALFGNYVKDARFLLEHGADPNDRVGEKTLVGTAEIRKFDEFAVLLREFGGR